MLKPEDHGDGLLWVDAMRARDLRVALTDVKKAIWQGHDK